MDVQTSPTSKKRQTETKPVDQAWNDYGDFTFCAHKPWDKARIDSASWRALGGKGKSLYTFNAGGDPVPVIAVAFGRVSANSILRCDARYYDKYDLEKVRYALKLEEPFPSDRPTANFSFVDTFGTVLDNVDKLFKPRTTITDTGISGRTLTIGQGLFRVNQEVVEDKDDDGTLSGDDEDGAGKEKESSKSKNTAADDVDDDEYDYSTEDAAAPEHDLYAPIDTGLNELLTRANWPWPKESKVPAKLYTLDNKYVPDPLPAYKPARDGGWKLMMPGEYERLLGAFCCVHFSFRSNYFSADKKTVFTADIRRIEMIRPAAVTLGAGTSSPRKERVNPFRSETSAAGGA